MKQFKFKFSGDGCLEVDYIWADSLEDAWFIFRDRHGCCTVCGVYEKHWVLVG